MTCVQVSTAGAREGLRRLTGPSCARHADLAPTVAYARVDGAEHGKVGDGAWTTPVRTKQISRFAPAEKQRSERSRAR